MATKALTNVAQRPSRDLVPMGKAFGRDQGWRELIIRQDADGIWQRVHTLVRTAMPDESSNIDLVSQELFLNLLTTNRLLMYIEQGYADKEIELDLLSLLIS